MIVTSCVVISEPVFTEWPGTLSTYQDQSLTLAWKLNVDLSTATDWHIMTVFYSGMTLYKYYRTSGNEVYDPAYINRSQGFINNSKQQLGLILHGIKSGDVGSNYKCAVAFASNIENDQAEILLFGNTLLCSL
jgi:hypothetical protein